MPVEVADLLGFTFEVEEEPMLQGESYTNFLMRTVDKTDVWLSWWLRTEERMKSSTMLFGHVDASPVLVNPPPKPPTRSGKASKFPIIVHNMMPPESTSSAVTLWARTVTHCVWRGWRRPGAAARPGDWSVAGT